MTRLEMEAVINAGGTVLWNGRILYTIGELPSQDDIDALLTIGNGPSAYEVAVENGFVGTEAEWLASLIGPEGPEGPQGEQGIQGEPGADGTGAGDVLGPASATNNNIAVFDGVTGKLLKDGGATLASKQDALGYTPVPNTRTVNGHALSSDVTVTPTDLGLVIGTNVEAHDADLTTIAGLSPTNDDVLQRKAGAWTNRTPTQLKSDLSLAKADVGLSNVDNTSDTGKPVSTAQQTAIDGKVDDTAYNAGTWDGVTTIAPSKNAVRDKIEALAIPVVSDVAYDATTWDANLDAPSKNAVRDKIESMGSSVDDTAYNATSWNGVTTTAPSKNAVRDEIEILVASIPAAPDVQTFNANGTWTKPTGAKYVLVDAVGAGGGGGGGARGSLTSVTRHGGAGGGGGTRVRTWYNASDLPATVAVEAPAGGTSGAGATSNASAGGAGGSGGTSKFGTGLFPALQAGGGTAGPGGPYNGAAASGGAGGNVISGHQVGPGTYVGNAGAGGASSGGAGVRADVAATTAGQAPTAGGGGGGGGSITAANAITQAGTGSDGTSSGTANGVALDADGASSSTAFQAGGGGASRKGAGASHNGGNGGPGAGGGGGGSNDTIAAGNGGVGGAGRVVVTTYF